MAQPGNFTPILLYGSSTPTNVPLAANLTNSATGSEIAINVADKNLFFKDSGGVVNTVPIRQSSTSSNGWLSSTDWNTFNSKAPATSGTSILYGNGTGGFSNVTIGSGISFAGGTLSATGSGGTVTSVAALTLGTTGTDLSSTVANGTTTPVITLNVPTASATNRGALSAADWSTFNGKQAALVSGTNIKTVGGVTLLGSGDVGTIGVGYGGTGLTSVTAGYIPFGSSASALATSSQLTWASDTFTVSGSVAFGSSSAARAFSFKTTTNWNFSTADFIRYASNTATPRLIGLPLGADSLSSTTIGEYNAIWGIYDSSPTSTSTSSGLNGKMAYGAYAGHQWYVNGTEAMRITSAGYVGMGTVGGSARLEVSENSTTVCYFHNTAGTGVALYTGNNSWSAVSDERLKDIIEPIKDAANKVSSLRAVIGRYKTDKKEIRRSFLIAQDVQKVLPEVVDIGTDEQETLNIRYTEVIPLLVAAINDIKEQFDAYVASHP
jgi:hypothetical protein